MTAVNIELTKLIHMKRSRVLLAIYAFIILGLTALYSYGELVGGINIFNANQFVFSSLRMMMATLLPLIALYLASASIYGDYRSGAIVNMMLLPLKKRDIYFAKIIAVIALLASLLAVQFAISLVFGLLIDGGLSLAAIGSAVLSYLGAWLSLSLIAGIGALLTLVVNSTGLVLVIGYASYLLMGLMTLYLPRLSAILPTAITNNYGRLLAQFNLSQLAVLASYYIIVAVAGLMLFEQKEAGIVRAE